MYNAKTPSKRRSFGHASSRSGGQSRNSSSQGGRGGRGGRPSGSGRGRTMKTFDPSQFINKNPQQVNEEVYIPTHQFSDFAIDPMLKKTIQYLGMKTPSPIQDQVIPRILQGEDVVGLAETGTGKTAAFLLPLIEKKKNSFQSVTLILAPTRELAIQIDEEFKKLARGFRLFSVVCVGGVGIQPQIRQLKKTNQFIIGTPGRIKDLIDRRALDIKKVTTVVLDEADRMLDMGFINDITYILNLTSEERMTLFFSATMDDKTRKLVNQFTRNPVVVSVKKKDVTNSIEQDVTSFRRDEKFSTLVGLLKKDDFQRVIVFGSMKHSVQKLEKDLGQHGISVESIHGNKSHPQRQRSLGRFKKGEVQVLVATDVAARGVHVDNVSHVINYDLPNTLEDYIHRIGRTGRGSNPGKALTFIPQR